MRPDALSKAKTRLRFVDVGRGKATWEQDFNLGANDIEKQILRSIKEHSTIASRDIEFFFDGEQGSIVVGGFRTIGRIELAEATRG
jgi:hypothetical protein